MPRRFRLYHRKDRVRKERMERMSIYYMYVSSFIEVFNFDRR